MDNAQDFLTHPPLKKQKKIKMLCSLISVHFMQGQYQEQ